MASPPVAQDFYAALKYQSIRLWYNAITILVICSTSQHEGIALIAMTMLQYLLHLYMVIALWVLNQGLLEGELENTWGFGQVAALVMVGSTVIECMRGIRGTVHNPLNHKITGCWQEKTEYNKKKKEPFPTQNIE